MSPTQNLLLSLSLPLVALQDTPGFPLSKSFVAGVCFLGKTSIRKKKKKYNWKTGGILGWKRCFSVEKVCFECLHSSSVKCFLSLMSFLTSPASDAESERRKSKQENTEMSRVPRTAVEVCKF